MARLEIAERLKKKKEELGMTTATLAKLSGVPVGTLNKILNGETKSPRYSTLEALEHVLFSDEKPMMIRDAALAYDGKMQGEYTVEDYRELPEWERAELIDGVLIYAEAPSVEHQMMVAEVFTSLFMHVKREKGPCTVLMAPLDVQLDRDDRTMVQPDVVVICQKEKINRKCIYGAPDLVVEVTSPATRKRDYMQKMVKYQKAGVREYWAVDLQKQRIVTYYFEEDVIPTMYTFQETVPVKIFGDGLGIDFAEIRESMERMNE